MREPPKRTEEEPEWAEPTPLQEGLMMAYRNPDGVGCPAELPRIKNSAQFAKARPKTSRIIGVGRRLLGRVSYLAM